MVKVEEKQQLSKELRKLNKIIKEQKVEIFQLKKVVDSLPGSIYWKNKEGIYLGRNRFAAEKMKSVELESKAIVGKTDYELFPEEAADIFRKHDLEVMNNGTGLVKQESIVLKDGSVIIQLSTKEPLRDENNNIVGVIGNTVDITPIKKIEQELKEAKEHAEAANEVIRIFASSIAHELRTPLASISGNVYGIIKYLPILIDGYQKAKEAELPIFKIRPDHYQSLMSLSNNIESEIEYAKIIIDMLLMKTNFRDKQNIDFKICSIEECVEKALSRYPFSYKGEENLIKLYMSENFLFNGIEIFMVHIIFNLIKNSLYYIKAIRKGKITIWSKKGKTHNYLYFKDTGKGIAKEFLPHIFDNYFSQTPYGAGIGLAFCKQVMRNFLGDIECESKEGKYTKFILRFPVIALE